MSIESEVQINNANIDSQVTIDGGIITMVQGWISDTGSTRLFNLSEAAFIGESGNLTHPQGC